MNKTMAVMMKPVNPDTIRANSEETKAAQNAAVLTILRENSYSMNSYEVGQALDTRTLPGYQPRHYWDKDKDRMRIASRILKRLESKGEVISTLYQGRRLYSVPATPDELMKSLIGRGEQ